MQNLTVNEFDRMLLEQCCDYILILKAVIV